MTPSTCDQRSLAKRPRTLSHGKDVRLSERSDYLSNEDETSSSGTSSSESEGPEQSSDCEDISDEASSSEGEESSNAHSIKNPMSIITPKEASNLQTRLKSFLPKIQYANTELVDADGILKHQIDHVSDDEKHYIEMNLGLGVLSEQQTVSEEEIQYQEPTADDDDDAASTAVGSDSPQHLIEQDAMAALKGERVQYGQKRKIEDIE